MKLYCYADETGQDTRGKFFIVAAVVTDQQRESLHRFLEAAEKRTGKGKVKWNKAQKRRRDNYIESVLRSPKLKNNIYYRVAEASGAYEELTILAIAQAVHAYTVEHDFKDYRVTVIVDGLKGAEIRRFGHDLRQLGIKVHKVRGAKDQSEPVIRLADAVAGLVRQSYLGATYYQALKEELRSHRRLHEL